MRIVHTQRKVDTRIGRTEIESYPFVDLSPIDKTRLARARARAFLVGKARFRRARARADTVSLARELSMSR